MSSLLAVLIALCMPIIATHSQAEIVLGESVFVGQSSGDRTISSYLGIPFAEPPTAERRWKVSQRIRYPHRVYPANAFAPACYQGDHISTWYRDIVSGFGGDPSTIISPAVSEDCLYLNLWKPAIVEEPLPVIIFVHGGSNAGGWAWEPNYYGENLARKGAIVITVAYRLGAFGFLAHPGLTETNFGLSDIVTALEWVKRYIAGVGGDPANVTVMGESSGASNLSHLLAMPSARGLFQRMIHQSAGWALSQSISLEDGQLLGQKLQKHLKATSIDSMREFSAKDIESAASSIYRDAGFDPIVDANSLSSTPLYAALQPSTQTVDLLIGSNADEWKIYIEADDSVDKWLDANIDKNLHIDLKKALADASPTRQLDSLRTAVNYVCPSLALASVTNGQIKQSWVYYFSRQRKGKQAEEMGAYHGAELPYVFDTHDDWLPTGSADRALTEKAMSYWFNFALTGSPNSADTPYWPPYTAETATVQQLDYPVRTISHPSQGLCKVFEESP